MRALLRPLIVAVLVLAVRPVSAEDIGKVAREAYTEGKKLFELGKFEQAIEEFERAYKAKPDAVYLYNIAQAHRLAENPQRALFFYRSYLRNMPRAPNRGEVLERIAQLERTIQERKTEPTQPPVEPPAKPPEADRFPSPSDGQNTPGTGSGAPPPRAEKPRRADLGLQAGVNFWLMGLRLQTDPSFAFSISGGYTPWLNDRLAFRIGGRFGYSFITDTSRNNVSFLSLLVSPQLFVRLFKQYLYFFVEIGAGVVIFTGVQPNSALIQQPNNGSGSTFTAFELRPAVGLEYRIRPLFSLSLVPGVVFSSKPHPLTVDHLLRFDLSLGATFRF